MTAPVISEATRGDLDAVAALVNAAYRGEAARRGWTHEAGLLEGQRTDARKLQDELDAPDPSVILTLREASDPPGEPPAACVMMQRFFDDDDRLLCHLAMLTVAPDRQGRGLGAALIGEVERRAAAMGCRAVEMTVIQLRTELLAFYARRGYRPTGATKPFPYADERFGRPLRDDLHFVVIEKALPPDP